jgi:branched-chain amino acid transport system substrate-binding protein
MAAVIPRPARGVALLTVALLAALSLVGCRGGDGNGGAAAVTLGFINQEGTPAGSFPEARRGAEAAVRHVNADLGGLKGRRLRLEVCTTRGTPESSQACATELASKRPVAVLGGVDLGAGASVPVLARAGIPYVGGSPALGGELTSEDAFMLAGGTVADILGQGRYALQTLKARRVAALYVDLPGALSRVIEAAPLVLQSLGATDVKLVAERADAADFVPALRGAVAGNPDVLFVIFPAQSCARIMSARQALGIRVDTFYPGACASKAVIEAAGAAAEGAWFASSYLPFGDPSPEVAVWRARVEDESALSQAGFATVMNVHRLLVEAADTGAEPSAAELRSRLKAAREHPGFMAHAYTCDGAQMPFLPSVCNPYVRILRHGGGRLTDVGGDWVNGATIIGGPGP